MAPIYAYITHQNGAADDSALELISAARKIDAASAVTAIVTGAQPVKSRNFAIKVQYNEQYAGCFSVHHSAERGGASINKNP